MYSLSNLERDGDGGTDDGVGGGDIYVEDDIRDGVDGKD